MIENIIVKKNNLKEINLLEHSLNIAVKCKNLMEKVTNDSELIWLGFISGLMHDIGKSSNKFQAHIKNGSDDYILHNILGRFIFLKGVILCCNDSIKNGIYKNIISKVILYHHPINFQVLSTDLMNEIEEEIIGNKSKYEEILNEFIHINNEYFPSFKLQLNESFDGFSSNCLEKYYKVESIDDYKEQGIPLFSNSKQDIFQIIVNVLRFADSIISSYNETDNSWEKIINRNCELNTNDIKMPIGYDEIRFTKQVEDAKILCDKSKNYHIYIRPTGFGKTMLGILYSIFCGNQKIFWVCPRNSIAKGVFDTLSNEIKELKLDKKISIDLLLTNEFKNGNKNADIIVTNIDNFLKPMLNNGALERSYRLFHSTCIFDEFHEYVMQEPLMALFQIVVKSRIRLDKVKTLFMSATPIMNFFQIIDNDYKEHILSRMDENDNDVLCKKYHLFLKDEYEKNDIDNGLISTITTEKAQEHVINGFSDKTIHARFLETDKSNLLTELSNQYGKNKGAIKQEMWSSTNFISTGIDVSFKNMFIYAPLPNRMIQTLGRCNRWNEYNGICENKIYISKAKKNDNFFLKENGLSIKDESKKYKSISDKFYSILEKNIGKSKHKIFTLKELYNLKDEYYEKEEKLHYNAIFLNLLSTSFKNLSEVDYAMLNDSIKEEELKKLGKNVIRGKSNEFNFYCLLKDSKTNEYIEEPFIGNTIIFNKELLSNDDFLDEVKKFYKTNYDNSYLNIEKYSIDYFIWKAREKKYALPITQSWVYDKKLGVVKLKN